MFTRQLCRVDVTLFVTELRRKYVSPSEIKRAIHKAILTELANAPLQLFNTNTGLLCDREAQIKIFEASMYKELVSLITTRVESLQSSEKVSTTSSNT